MENDLAYGASGVCFSRAPLLVTLHNGSRQPAFFQLKFSDAPSGGPNINLCFSIEIRSQGWNEHFDALHHRPRFSPSVCGGHPSVQVFRQQPVDFYSRPPPLAATAAIKASVFLLRLRDDYKPHFSPGQAPRRSHCYLVSRLLSSGAARTLCVFFLKKLMLMLCPVLLLLATLFPWTGMWLLTCTNYITIVWLLSSFN